MLTDSTRNADFPSLKSRTYLNTAAEGIPPRPVIEALGQYGQDKLLGMDGRNLHEAQWRGALAEVARAYGLTDQDVGICSCSSEAYNLAALALGLRDGDEVIVNDLDFPAGSTPWLQSSCAATAKVWRARAGALRVEDLVPSLGPKTRLLTVSLVSFFNGYRIPLEQVIEAVHAHSPALLALDVTQALGRVPLNLEGVDLIVSSTHKWILASHGGGLVGVPPGRAEQWTVPAGGWFNLSNAFDQDRFDRIVTRRGAASFTVGMPNYAAVYAVRAGLNYIQSVGVENIDEHCRPLVRACLDGLKKLPVDLITPDEPGSVAGIMSFRHEEPEGIAAALRDQDIHIMCHAGRLRVAIHGYNTMADVERFLRVLADALG